MIHWRKGWGLFWPDYDAAPERTYRYVLKHLPDLDMTVQAAPHHRVVVQAGGHVGIWPRELARHFDHVLTFEPDPALFECLRRNTANLPNVRAYNWALGREIGAATMREDAKAGSWAIDAGGTVPVRMATIDSVLGARGLVACDAIVLDVEGYELEALRGASATIQRDRPLIHVEELGRNRAASAAYMASIGYLEKARAGRDALYIHGGTTC